MIWENRTRLDPTLRKLTHSDSTEENVHIEDIGSNVSANGTPLNADNMNIFEKNIGSYGNDTYSSQSTYLQGQYVIYEGLIYRAKANISTPENFNPSHWDLKSLFDLVKENAININENTSDIADNTSDIADINDLLEIRTWDSSTEYQVGDIVNYSGNLYVALTTTTNEIPSETPLVWQTRGNIVEIIENANSEIAEIKAIVNEFGYHEVLAQSLTEGNTVTLSESLYNYKFVVAQVGTSHTWILCPVIPVETRVRGVAAYSGSSNMELFSVTMTLNEEGTTLQLPSGRNWRLEN